MLRSAKRRFLYAGLGAFALILAVPFLPQSFLARMGTITEHSDDESASTRVAVWAWTLNYVKDHPFGGGFDAYRSNSFTYRMPKVTGTPPNVQVTYETVTDKGRAYHSSYFEMLGEQGYPGLALWLAINLIGLILMEAIRRRYRKSSDPEEAWIAPLASALQSAHLVYLLGSAFIAIAFQPFVFELIGAQIGLDTYLSRKR